MMSAEVLSNCQPYIYLHDLAFSLYAERVKDSRLARYVSVGRHGVIGKLGGLGTRAKGQAEQSGCPDLLVLVVKA